MKKTILAAILLATASHATTLDDVPYDTTMWSALDPFGFVTLRASASSNWVNSVILAHGTNTAVHANKLDVSVFTATNAAVWTAINELAVRAPAWEQAYSFIATGTAGIANNSNRINTANANIANNSNRINTAFVYIAANSNAIVTLDAKLVATSNALASASGGASATAETVTGPQSNLIAIAWQNPASATNWTWTSDGHEITLTSYNFSTGGNDVVIPDMLDGLPVTGFGMSLNPEGEGTSVVSVSGGANITTVDGSAFIFCGSLTSVNLKSATAIGMEAFTYCTSLTSVSLPQATTIGYGAFAGCVSLVSVSLPQATAISPVAFNGCISLTSMSLPQVTVIGDSAFGGCGSLVSVYWGAASAPVEPTGLFTDLPANQVTNYVTNPTATGWGATFGGMPVVRMPIEAKSANIGTIISITSTTTNLTVNDGLTLGGVARTTWPDAVGSSAPLAWTPITTLAGGTVLTANVTTARGIYNFSADVAVTLTNNLSALTFNCTTNYDWQVWVNMNTQAALNSIATNWHGGIIEWLGGAPDFSCTGLYKFAMSTACGTRIQARQIYPTVYPWVPALRSSSKNNYATTFSAGTLAMLAQTDTNAVCSFVRQDFTKPVLFKFYVNFGGAEAYNATNAVYARMGLGSNEFGALYPTGFPTVAVKMNTPYSLNHMYVPALVWQHNATRGHLFALHLYRTNTLSSAQSVSLGDFHWFRTANELEQVAGTNKAAWATAYQ